MFFYKKNDEVLEWVNRQVDTFISQIIGSQVTGQIACTFINNRSQIQKLEAQKENCATKKLLKNGL